MKRRKKDSRMTSGIMDDENKKEGQPDNIRHNGRRKKYGAKAPQTGQIKRRNTAINRTK